MTRLAGNRLSLGARIAVAALVGGGEEVRLWHLADKVVIATSKQSAKASAMTEAAEDIGVHDL